MHKHSKFTQEQIAFFAHHKIPLDKVFFAEGRPSSYYGPKMKSGGYIVAVDVTPCARHGHRIRSRSGTCVQCNTSALAYQKRHDIPGIVYIAITGSNQALIKVGVTTDPSQRQYMLNLLGYGGYSDWRIVYTKAVTRGGEVESQVHTSLAEFQHQAVSIKQGAQVVCYELFECPFEDAKALIENLTGNGTADVQGGEKSASRGWSSKGHSAFLKDNYVSAYEARLASEGAGYKVGQKVKLPAKPEWGVGTVVSFQGDSSINVNFAVAGNKMLSTKCAKLERVD